MVRVNIVNTARINRAWANSQQNLGGYSWIREMVQAKIRVLARIYIVITFRDQVQEAYVKRLRLRFRFRFSLLV